MTPYMFCNKCLKPLDYPTFREFMSEELECNKCGHKSHTLFPKARIHALVELEERITRLENMCTDWSN